MYTSKILALKAIYNCLVSDYSCFTELNIYGKDRYENTRKASDLSDIGFIMTYSYEDDTEIF